MAYTDDLETARDNYARQLAEISMSPKPSYKVGDQDFTWQEYQAFLSGQVEHLTKLIAQGSPWEIIGAVR